MPVSAGGLDHVVRVGDVAVSNHALQIPARQRRDERIRARGQQEPVVLCLDAIGRGHQAALAIHVNHLLPCVQGDPMIAVPGQRIQHNLVQRLLARQHRRQQNAVVVRMWLGTEHRDFIQIRCKLQQLFKRADAGHAVADHHQLHLLHANTPSADMVLVVRDEKHEPGQPKDLSLHKIVRLAQPWCPDATRGLLTDQAQSRL